MLWTFYFSVVKKGLVKGMLFVPHILTFVIDVRSSRKKSIARRPSFKGFDILVVTLMWSCRATKEGYRWIGWSQEKAQKTLEHYHFTIEKCKEDWKTIVDLSSQGELNRASRSELDRLQKSFVLVLSADYQMTKLIPHWGYSDQPVFLITYTKFHMISLE